MKTCPVLLTFGKDIASIIYRHLYQLNMKNVNKQFQQGLEICEHNTVYFASAGAAQRSPPYPHTNEYDDCFGISECIWFNFRARYGPYSTVDISAFFHDAHGWHVRQPITNKVDFDVPTIENRGPYYDCLPFNYW